MAVSHAPHTGSGSRVLRRQIAKHTTEKPRCPVMLHFGKKDQHLPPSEIETIRRHRADLPLFLYDAGHGFNCDRRDSYDAPSGTGPGAHPRIPTEMPLNPPPAPADGNVLYVFAEPHYNFASADIRFGVPQEHIRVGLNV